MCTWYYKYGSLLVMLVTTRRVGCRMLATQSRSHSVYAVTGADGPLGVATTAALVSHGATVVMGCADAQRGRMLADKLNAATNMQSAICSDANLDLGSTSSIHAWADALQDEMPGGSKLEALVHHAGIMGLGAYTKTVDGDEGQWATNYLGPFRLTQRLWPLLLRSDTKIVCLTSTSHCTPNAPLDFSMACSTDGTYHGWGAFQQSKLASLLFSNELQRRFAASGSGATSRAVCELDKWFILPQLLLPDDKADLAAGPVTTLAALGGLGEGGDYLVDSSVGTPGEHAMIEDDARRLWEVSSGARS